MSPGFNALLKGRRGARAVALKILYALDVRSNLSAAEAIDLFIESFSMRDGGAEVSPFHDPDLHLDGSNMDMAFMEFIVKGVWSHLKKLDTLIETVSENWRVYRMSIVDRNIIRISLFELLHCEEIPPKVSINEAIELGKIFGDKDSASFINGILDRIYQTLLTPREKTEDQKNIGKSI